MAQCPPAPAGVVSRADATYPEAARGDHLEGTALIKVELDASGKVIKSSVRKSAGAGVLDQAALKAAAGSTYRPAVIECKPAESVYIMVVDFKP